MCTNDYTRDIQAPVTWGYVDLVDSKLICVHINTPGAIHASVAWGYVDLVDSKLTCVQMTPPGTINAPVAWGYVDLVDSKLTCVQMTTITSEHEELYEKHCMVTGC